MPRFSCLSSSSVIPYIKMDNTLFKNVTSDVIFVGIYLRSNHFEVNKF